MESNPTATSIQCDPITGAMIQAYLIITQISKKEYDESSPEARLAVEKAIYAFELHQFYLRDKFNLIRSKDIGFKTRIDGITIKIKNEDSKQKRKELKQQREQMICDYFADGSKNVDGICCDKK